MKMISIGRGRGKIRPPRRVSDSTTIHLRPREPSLFVLISLHQIHIEIVEKLPQARLYSWPITCASCHAIRVFVSEVERLIISVFRSSFLWSSTISGFTNMKFLNSKGLTGNDDLDFDGTWAILASSLREINTKNPSNLSFEQLYRNAYKLVLKKKGDALYEKVKNFERDWLLNEVQPQILAVLSTSLFTGDAGGSATANTNERRVAGEKLLKSLKHAWEDHNTGMNMTTDVLMYMVKVA